MRYRKLNEKYAVSDAIKRYFENSCLLALQVIPFCKAWMDEEEECLIDHNSIIAKNEPSA